MEEILLYAIVGILVGLSKGGLGGPVPVALTVPLMTLIIEPQIAVALVLPLLIFADVFALYFYWRRWDRRLIVLMLAPGLVGVALGALAGYFGGWTDLVLSRLFELWAAIPTLFLIITVAAFFPPSLFFVMIILGFTGWVGIARLTRSQFLQVRSYDFVSAAKSLGYSSGRIMFIHILPNAIAPVLIPAAFGVAGAILAESGLSFLGIGVPAEAFTWGAILAGARNNTAAWWLVIVPGFAIFITVTLYNLLGDGLRDALDPKMKV